MEPINTKGGKEGRGFTVAIVSAIVAIAVAVAGFAAFTPSGSSTSGSAMNVRPTAAQVAEWRQATATPFQRQVIVEKMQAAFAGVATVGTGPVPNAAPAATKDPDQADAREVVALGITGDHFWVIASYADMARGAIWGAVGACVAYGVPSWICSAAGWTLTTWSQGWGYANNHGVWAAVYWWPPHITGGRW